MAETDLMRLPDMPLHDPFVVADERTRTYYLYTSNDPSVSGVEGTGTMVYRSHDLRYWMRPVVVFRTGEQEGLTDGPQLHRTPEGALLMLWSTYEKHTAGPDGTISGGYVQTYAVSRSGHLEGPWEQRRPLVRDDSGHGMLFHAFDDQLMMILHRPFENARGKLYEMRLDGDELRVLRRRTDLDGGG